MKTLPGQELGVEDYARLRAAVDAFLWDEVYAPVVALVRPALPAPLRPALAPGLLQKTPAHELTNTAMDEGASALARALRDGRVQLVPDPTGEGALFVVAKPERLVSDGLKAFGARLAGGAGEWRAPAGLVPAWVRAEAAGYRARMQATHAEVDKLVGDLGARVDAALAGRSFAAAADHAVAEVQKGGWRLGAQKIQVAWDFGPAGQLALQQAYARTRNIQIRAPGSKVDVVGALDLATKREVQVWAHEALARLRTQVQANAEHGYRAAGLADRIREEYGVSKNRADLIARQETGNWMAAYREARAKDAGLRRYQWYCVRDARTRKDHLLLHGKVYSYDRPPITDRRTGARNNPGQDFRCRCVDRPIIE